MKRARSETEVLIVGAGPVGLTCSRLLWRLGIENLAIERRAGLHGSPQAHVVSARTMEIFRAAGIDEAALRAESTPLADVGQVVWTHTLAGPVLGQLPILTPASAARMLNSTPTPPANISQHRTEPLLFAAVRAAGGHVDFCTEWRALEQDSDGVTVRAYDLRADEEVEIRAQYVLACDGAGSRVRSALGIDMHGPDRLQAFVNICIEANLREVVRDRPAILYWHLDPEQPGAFIAHDIDVLWVYMHPYDPETEQPWEYDEPRCREVLQAALGAPLDFRIRSIDFWSMTAQVAGSYRRDRVLLVGDAAHRFPPTGGIGMNTGISDAFNLVWKLAAVRDGRAGARLLDTYGEERRAIAQANSNQSLRNALKMDEVVAALEAPLSLGAQAARLRVRRLPDDAPRRARVQAAIEAQAEHFDMSGLDLGQQYASGALVGDGTPAAPTDVTEYVPGTRPGARLPHVWLERDGARISTLDLVDTRELVLLTGASGRAWQAGGLPTVVIGDDGDVRDPGGEWAALREIGDAGALLLRPDGHVAWRSHGACADPAAQLEKVRRAVLCS